MTDLKQKQKEEGFIIMLVIISVGEVVLGIIQNNSTMLFAAVATILIDTVMLLDYNKRYPQGVKNEIH